MSEKETMQYELLGFIGMRAISELTRVVNEYLSKGWKLYGNPIVLENGYYAYQAMIKEKESEEIESKEERPSGQVLL